MSSRLEDFRKFVSKHPEVRNDVLSGTKSWQQIYEDWALFGEESDLWKFNQGSTKQAEELPKSNSNPKKLEDFFSNDTLKTIVGYVKKINPDTLSKTLNTIQKVLQITQGFSSQTPSNIYNASYNSWWE
jgi:hypothetical protein